MQLGRQARSRLSEAIAELLNRHVASNPCPMESGELESLWIGSLLPVEQHAFTALRRAAEGHARIPIMTATYSGVLLHMPDGTKLLLKFGVDSCKKTTPIWRRLATPVNPYNVLPPDRAVELDKWARLSAHIWAQKSETSKILESVLDLAKTPGQLHRMVPDLVKYTSNTCKQILEAQERRSPLPEEWMLVDRMTLRRAADHLALCHLLPNGDGNLSEWAWDRVHGLRLGYDIVRPGEPRLSIYHLPDDPNPSMMGTFSDYAPGTDTDG